MSNQQQYKIIISYSRELFVDVPKLLLDEFSCGICNNVVCYPINLLCGRLF